tara:strand:- start:68 stop:517 length:450 start_codon:yes stop_codon:yes gene_type:complete
MLGVIKREVKHIDIYYFIILTVSILSIFAYGKYRCDNIKWHTDVLEFSLFKNSARYGLDGWSVTHYSLFFLLGYLYPKVFVTSVLLGAVWELCETYIGIYKPALIKGLGFCELSGNKYKVWWYGKWSDIVLNTLGFISGMTLHNYLKKK